MAPGPLAVNDGMIRWERGAGTHEQRGQRGLIGRFARLASATDEEIGDFAREMGLLFLFPDKRGHGGSCAACTDAHGGDLHLPESYKVLFEHGAEPISAWRRLARDVAGCIKIAALLADDEPVTEEDWALFGNLGEVSAPHAGTVHVPVPSSVTALAYPEPMSNTSIRGYPRDVAAYIVNLLLGSTVPRLYWSEDFKEMRIESVGLLGELGLQLGRLFGGSSALAICAGCNNYFAPTKRPRAGEKSWCDSVSCKRKAKSAAQSTYRRNKSLAASG
jgi:hypothetical protein